MKLSLKFTLGFVVIVCIVCTIMGVIRVQREIALFEQDIQRDHEGIGRDLATAVERVWQLSGEKAALEFVEQANQSKSTILIRFLREDAPARTSAAAILPAGLRNVLSADKPVESSRVDRGKNQRIVTYVRVGLPDHRLGALELSESLDELRQYLWVTILRTIATMGFIVVFSGALGALLGLTLVGRPVQKLVRHAQRIGCGDFGSRLQLRRKDELGTLARELDSMAEQLSLVHDSLATETSARKMALEQLRHADRLTTVGTLASGIAHELGTPLNVILARAKMILGKEVHSDVAENARIISEQAHRISGAVRQLMDYSRRQSPHRVPTDVRYIVRQAVALLEPAASKANVSLQSILGEHAEMALVDAGQIQQVISNLVLNGIQAMRDGGEVKIGLESHDPGDGPGRGNRRPSLRLFVEDQGPGIPQENLEHIFEPFYTTKAAEGGTGLGLSIVAGIVQEHEGWIEVESRSGAGACVSVFLPKEPVECKAES